MEDKKPKKEEDKKFSYEKNNWGYKGKEEILVSPNGNEFPTIKMPSGTRYLKIPNGKGGFTLRRIQDDPNNVD